jgi:peptide chain release factor 3
VQARLEGEYNVKTKLEPLPHQLSRWVEGPEDKIALLPWRYGMLRTEDRDGRLVALFSSPHELNFYNDKYPDIVFNHIV